MNNVPALEPGPGTVAAYLRVSSRMQRDRETIASQREAVLAHAAGRGWAVPDEHVFADDGFSGATLDRPALEALRDAVASGAVEAVLAWSADRLSRNFAHQMLLQEEFARRGARIVFVQEPDDATPQGMLLRQMLSAISEYERTQIAERSRRGKLHRARQGSLNMISRPPYGYRLVRKTEVCDARLEIDAAEATVVRRIFDLYVQEGLTMNAVARRLDAEGIPPRHADRWPTATVAVVLRNEAYVGKAAYLKTVGTGGPARRNRTGRRQAGRVRRTTGRTARRREDWIELPVPAIIEAVVFERAQRRRAENRRFSPRRTTEPTLLQGLCVCAECGYAMGRQSGSGGRSGPRHYYRCHGIDAWRRPQGAVCDNPPARAGELDAAVWKAVLGLLGDPELVRSEIERRLAAAHDTARHDRRMAELRAESCRNQARMSRLLDAYQEGLVALDELRDRNAPLQTRDRAIRAELDALTTSKLDRESQLALATNVQTFLDRMRTAARTLSVPERQRIVRLLVREVRIGKDSVTVCHTIPLTDPPPPPTSAYASRGPAPGEAAGHGLLVPRCGQVVEQDVEAGVEQRLPALPQEREERPLVGRQLVQAAVQRVAAHRLRRPAQQIPHGAVAVPVPVQPPLAARVHQLVAHLRLEHVQPARALPARRQPRPPEPVQVQTLPQHQRQPARPPLPRPPQLQRLQLDPHHLAVQLRRLPVGREQRHGLAVRAAAQHLDRPAPRRPLAVVDLAEVQHLALHHPAVRAAAVLHHAPVAVLLAVLEASLGAQEHGPEACRNTPASQGPRSALQRLPQHPFQQKQRVMRPAPRQKPANQSETTPSCRSRGSPRQRAVRGRRWRDDPPEAATDHRPAHDSAPAHRHLLRAGRQGERPIFRELHR